MADDGMVLNFSVSETLPLTAPKRKFEGGSWKDRARAKKRAQNFSQRHKDEDKALEHVSANHVPVRKVQLEEFPESRPRKRLRENNYEDGQKHALQANAAREGRKPQSNANRDVVSSLFTSNPASSQPVPQPQEQETEEIPSKPSNAPLMDGIDTFTSLGLSPAIATHLLSKMDLKNPTAIQRAAVSQMLKEDGDAFIQSETGSGKTLAYLLPLVHRMTKIVQSPTTDEAKTLHRDSGLFAIILAPTRELCKQISVVLERLLGCAHYIVAGTVIGGEKKKSEKARLRKGINILVATPGRLVDHLENTSALDVSNVRWLVLDEGDRLMELGFEQDITKIIHNLDRKQRTNSKVSIPDRRTTILCSATLKMNVQKLGEISLKDAALIKGETEDTKANGTTDSAFLAPAQLKQSYIVVPSKLRLVTLAALLRRTFARKGSVNKAIVFLSCADSVEFHFSAITRPDSSDTEANSHNQDSSSPDTIPPPPSDSSTSIAPSPLLTTPNTPPLTLYKLHGSLAQPTRTAIINSFRSSNAPSLLFATDVASRGLDLPNLDLVIEYDPAFSSDDHLHRIGRTARLGRDGRAVVFLLPGKEEGYVDVLKSSYKTTDGAGNVTQTDATDVLRKGFSPTSGVVTASSRDWEARATDFQLNLERWVLGSEEVREKAKRAFQSHVRAYATHTAVERKWFDIRDLHLGHTAKGFGLREAPGRINVVGLRGKDGNKGGKGREGDTRGQGRRINAGKNNSGDGKERRNTKDEGRAGADDAARKMREVVRKQKKMMGGGADEFNLA